jgi:hypothetical protein
MNWQNLFVASYPLVAGAMLLGLGLLTLIRPEVLEYYSIGVGTASARTAIRAMIGGGEIGIGLVVLAGGRLGLLANQRCAIAATIFICVCLARLLGAGIEGELHLTSQPLREAFVELTLGCLGAIAAIMNRKVELNG